MRNREEGRDHQRTGQGNNQPTFEIEGCFYLEGCIKQLVKSMMGREQERDTMVDAKSLHSDFALSPLTVFMSVSFPMLLTESSNAHCLTWEGALGGGGEEEDIPYRIASCPKRRRHISLFLSLTYPNGGTICSFSCALPPPLCDLCLSLISLPNSCEESSIRVNKRKSEDRLDDLRLLHSLLDRSQFRLAAYQIQTGGSPNSVHRF